MEARIFKCCIFLISLLMGLLITKRVEAALYIVGDDDAKWTTSVNYQRWSEKYNFTVGDFLVFFYVKDQHNTYEVSQETYRSCDTSTGVIAKYYSGYDVVALAEARDYWFICSIRDHCVAGMKLGVKVQPATDINDSGTDYYPSTASTETTSVVKWTCHLAAVFVGLFMLGC